MKKLGSLLLPDGGDHGNIEWADKYDYTPVAGSEARTLGGAFVSFSQLLTDGRPITLIARDPFCWLTLADVVAIKAMADQPGASFTLEWDGGELHTVRFRHDQPPSVEFAEVMPGKGEFFGTIKLITV